MAEISRVALFGKLDPLLYKALEGATVVCKLRGNPYVEIAHWLQQILQTQDSDIHRIVREFLLEGRRFDEEDPHAGPVEDDVEWSDGEPAARVA